MTTTSNRADRTRPKAYKSATGIQIPASTIDSTQIIADAPKLKLHLDELKSPSMAVNPFYTTGPPTPPPKQNGFSPVIRSLSPHSEQYRRISNLEMPRRVSQTDPKRQGSSSAMHASDADPIASSPSTLPSNEGSANDTGHPWSSAVGRATTGGKSGRVIERLMNDNDRLLREKKLAIVKLEEEVKRGESARSALESLQVSNQNFVSMHEADTSLLARRDRRIQQLRDDLEAERAKREKAERETRDTRTERDGTIETLRKEAAEDKEQSTRMASQYETLSKSWKGLEARYLKQTEDLRIDVASLKASIEGDKQKLAQMEIIMEQMGKETERTGKAKEKLMSDFEIYKVEQEESIRDILHTAQHNEASNDEGHRQLQEVLGQMRYVVNVKKHVRDAA